MFSRAKADSILTRALELPPDKRERFLDENCEPGSNLRLAIDRMLQDCEDDDELILQPGAGATGPLWNALARDYAAAFVFDPGDRLGAYRVVRVLGRGGMATVYLAERADGQFEQSVALKVLDIARDFDALATRFAQERRILASLEHPNIARLIDGGMTRSGQPYVVMEYVDGEPIDRYCDRHRLSIDQRIKLFSDVVSAVQYAHGHLIVHRDIKPSNILVKAGGEPKLLDFGIAKLLDPEAVRTKPITRSAIHPMTPEYASPEQVRGGSLTVASDVYQLGFLLYSLLTGCAPYPADRGNVAESIRAILSIEPMRPSEKVMADGDQGERIARCKARATTCDRLRRQLAGDLDNIVLVALHKEPERRYSSAISLRDDLQRHRDGMPVIARPPAYVYRARKFVDRHRAGVAAAVLVALAIVGGLSATAWQARATAREAMRAAEVRDFLIGLFESVDPNMTRGEIVTAKELLDRGAAKLEHELADVPMLRAEMLGVIGRMYRELGLYQEARPLLVEANATLRRTGQTNTAALAQSADDLANVLYEQGDYIAAEQIAREALSIHRQRHREQPEALADSMVNLAAILNARGNQDDAERLYLEALAIDEHSSSRSTRARHLSNFAGFLFDARRYEEAHRSGEAALDLQRAVFGTEHTLVATSLLNLSATLVELGDFAAGEALLRESLSMRQKLLGRQHPHVAAALNNLGHLLQKAGRLGESEDAHREALSIQRSVLGEQHPNVANTLNSLGIVQYFNGQYRQAADTFERVLPIWRNAHGLTHPNVLAALNNLGASLREARDFAGAKEVLTETLALRREVFGETNREVAQSLNNLALVLARLDENAAAEAMFRDAIAMWRQTMGEGHPDVGDGLQSLGTFLLDEGRYVEAETLLRESLKIRERTLDSQAPLLASSRLYLGETLVKVDQPSEAEPLILLSLPVLADHWGNDAEITQRAEQALEDVQRALLSPKPE